MTGCPPRAELHIQFGAQDSAAQYFSPGAGFEEIYMPTGETMGEILSLIPLAPRFSGAGPCGAKKPCDADRAHGRLRSATATSVDAPRSPLMFRCSSRHHAARAPQSCRGGVREGEAGGARGEEAADSVDRDGVRSSPPLPRRVGRHTTSHAIRRTNSVMLDTRYALSQDVKRW